MKWCPVTNRHCGCVEGSIKHKECCAIAKLTLSNMEKQGYVYPMFNAVRKRAERAKGR